MVKQRWERVKEEKKGSEMAKWEMKNCTPLRREAHFEVKMDKTHQLNFLKLRCRKSVGRCSAKNISKSKFTKHTMHGPLLEVRMPKKCGRLWREAHFQVKMYKTRHARTTFGRSDVFVRGRRKGEWTLPKVSKTWGFRSSLNYNYNYNTLHYIFATLHNTPQHSTTIHDTTPHYTTLHDTTRHYTNYSTLHCNIGGTKTSPRSVGF